MTIWSMRIACWVPKALRLGNGYCFSDAIMYARARLSVTLYVHCLYCFSREWACSLSLSLSLYIYIYTHTHTHTHTFEHNTLRNNTLRIVDRTVWRHCVWFVLKFCHNPSMRIFNACCTRIYLLWWEKVMIMRKFFCTLKNTSSTRSVVQ